MQYVSKIALITALFSSLGLASQVTSAQEFYKWIDSKGSTHYTTTPPPKSAKKLSKVDTYGSRQHSQAKSPAPNPNEQNNSAAQPEAKVDVQQQEANAALQQGLNRR